MPGISIFLPFLATRPEHFIPYMALVQHSAARRLWTGQPLSFDVNQGFAYAAGLGLRAPVGTAVSLMPLRHPFEAAMQARGLALTTGYPAVAGFGVGATAFQRAILGQPYASPLTAVREYFHLVRRLLDGELVDHDGEYFSMHGGQTKTPQGRVELGAGVLRPGMAEVAGEVADVAITWLAPPRFIRDVLRPHLEKGAARAGRVAPRVVSVVPFALRRPGTDPVELVHRANGRHLEAPHYGDMLRQAGVEVDAGDARARARALLDAGVFLYGDPREIASRLAAFDDAGVDEVALHLSSANAGQPMAHAVEDLKATLEAVDSL
ncbi:MAG: LLM class flavin-dependent oxidoreductase [Egibacteraceae bacterium]